MAGNANTNSETARWSNVEVDKLIEIMIEQVRKGNKTGATFNKAGWKALQTQLEASVGRPFSSTQFRNKVNKLRIDYSNFKKLLETTSFGWNPITKSCTAEDDVWERHIQANPTWAKFRRNGLPQWPELQMIFGDTYACGDNGYGNAEDILDDGAQAEEDIPTIPLNRGLDDIDEVVETPEERPINTHRRDRTPTARRKKSRRLDMASALHSIADASRLRSERYANSIATQAVTGSTDIVACQALLDTMTEISKDLYLKAVKRMWEDSNWRRSFVTCIPERRSWFLEMLD